MTVAKMKDMFSRSAYLNERKNYRHKKRQLLI